MSFQISKNKMSFVADNKQVSKKLTTTTEKVVEKGTTFLLDTINYLASDEIFHATFQFRAHLPNLPMDNFPDGLTVTVNDVLTESCKITTNGDYILGSSAISNTTPITSIKFNVTANPTHHFVFPVGSVLHYGVLPNESQETVANIPTPPAIIPTGPPAIVHGFSVPAHSGIPDDLEGDYRRFPYSFDRTGTAVTHKVVGIYERSVDDGSKITVNITMLYQSDGWDIWSIFKREYEGAEYSPALAIHNAGSGHADYSSGYDFSSDTDWVERTGNQYFRSFNSYSDGSGHCPQLYHTGDISLTTIQPT